MQNKKVPMRTCIACKQCKPKSELVRIVKNDNDFSLDLTKKANGRGAYICDSIDCVELMIKNKSLNKLYKQNVPLEVYDEIKESFIASR